MAPRGALAKGTVRGAPPLRSPGVSCLPGLCPRLNTFHPCSSPRCPVTEQPGGYPLRGRSGCQPQRPAWCPAMLPTCGPRDHATASWGGGQCVPVRSQVVWARAGIGGGREALGEGAVSDPQGGGMGRGDVRPVGVCLGVGVGTAAEGAELWSLWLCSLLRLCDDLWQCSGEWLRFGSHAHFQLKKKKLNALSQ